MTVPSSASRLITTAARERLQPLGLRQRGRSRLWLDDHGWWLAAVDFFAPRSGQGSGLTVGAMWLWQDVGHVTFNVRAAHRGSQEFRNETQFAAVAADLARRAEQQAIEFRHRFADLDSVAASLLGQPIRRGDVPGNLNAGIAAALVGDASAARDRFSAVLAEDPFADWILTAQQTAQSLFAAADDAAAVREWSRAAVLSCRSKLALADVPESAGDPFA
ncbi:hypothetical protein OG592_38975 [Streptomyces avidinii]|uniref:hypothetical protein n=1 Tax=Streptomyces avidinii TaxID=1895 RepID=UPI00386DDFA9|nr:hypothetical protein OG592_38975 [Streptomyces avidinii]